MSFNKFLKYSMFATLFALFCSFECKAWWWFTNYDKVTVHNESENEIYAAIYYKIINAERGTNVYTIEPGKSADIQLPPYGPRGTRVVCVSKYKDRIKENLNVIELQFLSDSTFEVGRGSGAKRDIYYKMTGISIGLPL